MVGWAPSWSDADDALLREHYPDCALLRKLIPQRTLKAIQLRAQKLGVMGRVKLWKSHELKKAKQLLDTGATNAEILAAFPDRPPCRVWEGIARHYGRQERNRKADFPPGPLREIRQEARRRGMSLAEVARRSGLNSSNLHKPVELGLSALARLAAVVGGELVIEWEPLE
jgi:lambda repressor-like predicted transcriptional regulator